tara:strand:- start:6701 stop:8449 length:1749 start_codon:yes stop_codon:yes gene_type:complete
MPDLSQTQPFAFTCEGGLVKNRSTFIMQPGQALELLNFEPDIKGGYRRINGFKNYVNQIVPQTSASSEKVLMSALFNNNIVAARGEKIFTSASTELGTLSTNAIAADTSMTGSSTITVKSTSGFSSSGTLQINSEQFTYTGKTATTFTGVTRAVNSTTAAAHSASGETAQTVVSESWTVRDTGRTNAGKYTFERFNFDGNEKLIVTDGVNDPTVFNTSFSATDVTESSVEGAKFVTAFREHMFYAGMSSTPQEIIFSQPFDEDAFNTGSGAGSVKVDDTVVGLKVFRENLFIFCENRIFKLTGSSSTDFAIAPVTRDIGCINGDTIQEFAGDLIFLGPDGLRTVAGTAKIGDVALGTVSSNVQSLFDENIIDSNLFDSVVIADKTQYRIFFTKDDSAESFTDGVICVMKGQNFEFSEIRGIKPSCTDTFVETGDILVVHGGFDGYVYRQEKGNDFNGVSIKGRYRSPDLTFGDPGIRKHMHRVILNYAPESSINADMFVRYDYEGKDSARPAAYPLDSTDIVAIYGTSSYGTPTYGGASQPLIRQPVEGSGFAVALRVNDNATTAPYSLKGFGLEYQVGARR